MTRPTETATATAATVEDLSRMLTAPAGFVAVPGDTLSGPIDKESVYRVFSDRAGNPDMILSHGFSGGYIKNWKNPPPANDPGGSAIAPTTTVTQIVLRLDTEDNARFVLGYFNRQNAADGYRSFRVPATLADGYGVALGPDPVVGITYHGVAWRHGTLVLQVAVQYTQAPAGTAQVIDLALVVDKNSSGGQS